MTDPAALTVAVCQFAPTADRARNRRRVAELTAEAAARGAELVVLPEYASFFANPMDESLAANAEGLDGAFVQELTALAAKHGVVVIAGLVEAIPGETAPGEAAPGETAPGETAPGETAEGGRVRNALVAVDGEGIRAVYRKQHLYDAFGQTESTWIEAGEVGVAETFELGGLRIGLMTCYDLRFPEVARTLVDAGAEVIVVPAEWVRGPLKEHHWMTLLAARAIENTAYVVAADHPAPVGVGRSAVIDPQGVAIAGLGPEEGIVLARLSGEAVERARRTNPALRLRRYRVVPN